MLVDLDRYVSSGQPLEMIYLDRQGRITQRQILPYSITGDQMKAYCLTRRAIRSFLINHILSILPAKHA
ncbi:WYL domain-containing protein [Ammoniphilus sp. CFH 90114]|uniref:WYL domain-containing protein n=1 Tax=Ammoniphilus sp. CFH 90114 TaxID=2493665 RepID=UPI00100E8CC8|nr:WYL domain-containing protein [Ammoniphilus sp. CFH 90114]RXT06328.1 WYL domain-containing protein [Ammoniphilus sp. CFH 90114]